MILGTNLGLLDFYSPEWWYANILRQARWFSKPPYEWEDSRPLKRHANGGFLLEANQHAAARLFRDNVATPTGAYSIRYEGKGKIIPGVGVRFVTSEAGRITAEVSYNPQGVEIIVTESDPTDPIRNLDMRRTDVPADSKFHPTFLEQLRGFKVLRFMDTLRVNEKSGSHTWATRPLPTDLSQAGPRGPSLEDIVDLCNATGTDCYWNVFADADDEYVTNAVRLVLGKLRADLAVYLAPVGNESWNEGMAFHGAVVIKQKATQLGISPDQYHSKRAVEVFRLAESATPERLTRIRRVMEGQNVYIGRNLERMTYNEAYRHVDYLATAPYMDPSGTAEQHMEFFVGTRLVDDLVKATRDLNWTEGEIASFRVKGHLSYLLDKRGIQHEAQTPYLNQLRDMIQTRYARAWMEKFWRPMTELSVDKFTFENTMIAKRYGAKLALYEAGQHFVYGAPHKESNQILTSLAIAVSAHPMMYDVYRAYLRQKARHGVALMMHYAFVAKPSRHGTWGVLEYQGQPEYEAPKFKALRDYMRESGQLA